MLTLVDYRERDTDKIMRGVYDWMFTVNPLMHRMPVVTVKGNGVKYNVKTTRSSNQWTQPGDTIQESTGTSTQRSAAIYTLIGDADTDKSQIAANSTQNPRLLTIKDKVDDMNYDWQMGLVWGQESASSVTNQPKGLFALVREVEAEGTTDLDAPNNSQVVAGHGTSSALTIDMMDELADQMKMGITCYLMNRRMRRKLTSLARAAGNNLVHDNDELGHPVAMFGGIPIYVMEDDVLEDALPDSSSSVLDLSSYTIGTTRAAGNDNSAIFALRLAEDGFCLIQTAPFTHEDIGTVQNKDAYRDRFKWYHGFALYNKYGMACMTGVLDTALT